MLTNKEVIKNHVDKAFEYLKKNNIPEFIASLADSMDYDWLWQRELARDCIDEKLKEMKLE